MMIMTEFVYLGQLINSFYHCSSVNKQRLLKTSMNYGTWTQFYGQIPDDLNPSRFLCFL